MGNTNKSICFAYYGDNKFLGWYADSFGSIRPNSPKVYSNTDSQIETITANFRYKISKLAEKSDLASVSTRLEGLAILDESLNKDKTNLNNYKNIELRIVECPYYDGPNPNFDRKAYKEAIERGEDVKCDNWIYADYSLVKEWAKTEPAEFIGKITVS